MPHADSLEIIICPKFKRRIFIHSFIHKPLILNSYLLLNSSSSSLQCGYVDLFDFVHSVLVHLEGRSDPASTGALLPIPVKGAQLGAALGTQELEHTGTQQTTGNSPNYAITQTT